MKLLGLFALYSAGASATLIEELKETQKICVGEEVLSSHQHHTESFSFKGRSGPVTYISFSENSTVYSLDLGLVKADPNDDQARKDVWIGFSETGALYFIFDGTRVEFTKGQEKPLVRNNVDFTRGYAFRIRGVIARQKRLMWETIVRLRDEPRPGSPAQQICEFLWPLVYIEHISTSPFEDTDQTSELFRKIFESTSLQFDLYFLGTKFQSPQEFYEKLHAQEIAR